MPKSLGILFHRALKLLQVADVQGACESAVLTKTVGAHERVQEQYGSVSFICLYMGFVDTCAILPVHLHQLQVSHAPSTQKITML